ncbi:MAG: cupin domain-containing protein [Planctomycetota bacterium]|jgi:quercetin dioxygenase-like cupin family protein
MVDQQSEHGTIVELKTLERSLRGHEKTVLVEHDNLRIIQFAIPGGARIPRYEAHGIIILHCLAGRVSVTAMDQSRVLRSGQLLHLAVREAFSVGALEDASLLATIIIPPADPDAPLIGR